MKRRYVASLLAFAVMLALLPVAGVDGANSGTVRPIEMGAWGDLNPLYISWCYLTGRQVPADLTLTAKDGKVCYPSSGAMEVVNGEFESSGANNANDPIRVKLKTIELESAASTEKKITVRAIAPLYVDDNWIKYAPDDYHVNKDGIAWQVYDLKKDTDIKIEIEIAALENNLKKIEDSKSGYKGRYCIEIPVTLNIKDKEITSNKELKWRVDWDRDYQIVDDYKIAGDTEVSEKAQAIRENGGFEQTYILDLSGAKVEIKGGGTSGGNTENPGGTTQDPGSSTGKPGGTTQNPGSSTENPGGTTQNPGGSTDTARVTLPGAVRYVPWSVNLNKYGGFAGGKDYKLEGKPSWMGNRNGLLSGVPVSIGTYTFTVSYTNKSGTAVKENVSVEVLRASSGNLSDLSEENWDYRITDRAGDIYGYDGGCYLTSKGDYDQFRALYLDGSELDEGTDYGVWRGSTVVEIYPRALRAAGYGSHTVALAFLDDAGEMHCVAQNIEIKRSDSSDDDEDNRPRVTVNNERGGRVRAYSDGEVVITVNSGYYIAEVTVNGKSVSVGANGRLTGLRARDRVAVTFEENAVSRTATAASTSVWAPPGGTTSSGTWMSFRDVSPDAYFYEAVRWAVNRNIAKGTGNRTFQPNGTCSRADMLTFLWRACGSPEPAGNGKRFTDVPSGAYYAKAVQWASDKGLVKGEGKRQFNPNAQVTRGEAVTFLYRAAGSPAASQTVKFEDVRTGAYYLKPVAWALSSGVANGVSSAYFRPDYPCTRGDIMTFLYRRYG